MEVSVAVLTVKETGVEATLPRLAGLVAVMTVEPGATAVAKPLLPPALLMVATPVLLDDQLTWVVRFWVEESLKVPIAVKLTWTPAGMEVPDGATVREDKVALLTVRIVEPVTDPEVADIVVVPGATAVARELCAGIVATLVAEEAHVT